MVVIIGKDRTRPPGLMLRRDAWDAEGARIATILRRDARRAVIDAYGAWLQFDLGIRSSVERGTWIDRDFEDVRVAAAMFTKARDALGAAVGEQIGRT